jgi:hypothetical protein
MNYEFDYLLMVLIFIAIVFGVYGVVTEKREVMKVNGALFLLVIGMLLIIGAVISNSVVENQWTYRYVTSFLALRIMNENWYFRHLCAVGYFFLSVGIIALIVSVLLKKKGNP